MFSFFDYKTFIRIAIKSFCSGNHEKTPLTSKRIVFLICFFFLFPIFQVINAICFKLDELFFPAFRDVQLKQPVFIIGNPRSGTTHMHRLLALDSKRFYFFKAWEIIFPSIVQKKCLKLVGKIDALFGSHFHRFILDREKRSFQDLNKVHPSGLFLPEECEFLFIHIFSTYNLLFLFPIKNEFDWFLNFDSMLSAEEKKRIMSFYIECIKRQAFFKKSDGQFLSKSPGFSSKVDSLYQYFPECKIIYMLRSPMEVVPSVYSLVTELYLSAIDLAVDDEMLENVYQMVKTFYNYPLDRLAEKETSSYYIVNYDKLAKNPKTLITDLYKHFGFELNSDYMAMLNMEDQKAQKYVSRHQYSLAKFNLSKTQIVHDFEKIFDHFEFVKDNFE